MSKKFINRRNQGGEVSKPSFKIICSWCGALIRSGAESDGEQMCLICHARMLNDYFQKLRKFDGAGGTGSRRRL